MLLELRPGGPPAVGDSLTLLLRARPEILPQSVELIPRETALAELGDQLREDLADLALDNPLVDVISFNVRPEILEGQRLAQLAEELRALPGVGGVFYQDNFVDRIARNARRLGYGLLGLAALFTLVAALLIHNSVRLSLYANRFEIKTQELVGASWGFISRPYLGRALGQGLLAGLLAAGALASLHYWLRRALPELGLRWPEPDLLWLGGGLLLLGTLVNVVSHYVVVRRYLRLRLDELY